MAMSPRFLVGLATLFRVLANDGFSEEIFPRKDGAAEQRSPEDLTVVKDALYRTMPPPPEGWRTASGALRLNEEWEKDHSKPWFIEYQMQGGQYVSAGVILDNRDEVDWGLKIIEWGFSRMSQEGCFDHPDSYHSGAFFIESTAHALFLLQDSPMSGDFAVRIDALKPKLLAAVRHMIRPEIHAYNWPEPSPDTEQRERKYAHRRYLDAAAIGETGVLCGDPELVRKSEWFVKDGIAFQKEDGVNPEKGGHDTSYQAVGIMYALRYYQLVANKRLRTEMTPMVGKGLDWLAKRISPDGSIDMSGNTRTGPTQELSRAGKPKGQDFRAMVEAFAHWGWLTGNDKFMAVAERITRFMRSGKNG